MSEEIEKLKKEKENMQGQIDALNSNLSKITEERDHAIKEKDEALKDLETFRKKEREDIEEKVHALNPKYITEGKSNEVIEEYIQGWEERENALREKNNGMNTQVPKLTQSNNPGTKHISSSDKAKNFLNNSGV